MSWWKQKRDAKWYGMLMRLPTFEFHNMIRPDATSVDAAKATFFKDGTPPSFSFPKAERMNVLHYFESIDRLREEFEGMITENPLKTLYINKLDELRERAELLGAIQHRDDALVTELSISLFGTLRFTRNEIEKEIQELASDEKTFYAHSEPVTAEMFIQMIDAIGREYDFDNIRVKLFSGTSIKIKHNMRQGHTTVYVPENRKISKARAARLLTHEIEVHALRRENGLETPYAIIGHGLDRYIETEEGLALYLQKQLRKSHAHDPGLWDAYAIALAKEFAFPEVFDRLLQARKQVNASRTEPRSEDELKDGVWNLCRRTYRGIHHPTTPGLAYVRDHIYRSGLKEVENAVETHGESIIDRLFIGRVGIQHLKGIEKLDIPNMIVPRLISKQIVDEITKTA